MKKKVKQVKKVVKVVKKVKTPLVEKETVEPIVKPEVQEEVAKLSESVAKTIDDVMLKAVANKPAVTEEYKQYMRENNMEEYIRQFGKDK